MQERWAGFCVVASEVTVVAIKFNNDDGVLISEVKWVLEKGDRHEGYGRIQERAANFLAENAITHVVVMGSTVNRVGSSLAHLYAAELRGVIIAAAALSPAKFSVIAKAAVSRAFGQRNMDAYVKDDSFWDASLPELKNKGNRPAAMLILQARKA